MESYASSYFEPTLIQKRADGRESGFILDRIETLDSDSRLPLGGCPGLARHARIWPLNRCPTQRSGLQERITAGSFPVPGQQNAIPNLPPFCRVARTIRPSADSDIQFEVWLPDEGELERPRYLGVGNGGFCRRDINYRGIGSA